MYEVSEGPGKELTVCVSIELGTVSSEVTTLRLLTPPSEDNTGEYRLIVINTTITICVHE